MPRPNRAFVAMEIARMVALRSTCQRGKVGVVVMRDGRILVSGYNGAPAGMAHCTHSLEEVADPAAHCERAVHAEANAIAYAARWGISLEGGALFTTLVPCLACAQLIINAGIIRVVSAAPHRGDLRGEKLLKERGLS